MKYSSGFPSLVVFYDMSNVKQIVECVVKNISVLFPVQNILLLMLHEHKIIKFFM